MQSFTEENYLKAIYILSSSENQSVSTNAIAEKLSTKASSVTDMLKKLAEKKLIRYEKYQGAELTGKGKKIAINIIRKHRLWEVFLVNHLNFKWDEVHDIAEELEHINSEKLIEHLDRFLNFPQFDPHGDPIPDKDGKIYHHKEVSVKDLKVGESGIIVGVKEHHPDFLRYLENTDLLLGTHIKVLKVFEWDNSVKLKCDKKQEITISEKVAGNLYIKKVLNK
ncbi:MAG: metal-dependent transcriptional regulator [Bacteroidia bacterium]